MVASAPLFSEVAQEIYEMLSGNVFVAHNVNFDYSFVRHHLKQHGYDLSVKKLCTVRLSRKVFEGHRSYSLGNLCRNLSINIENRHRADGDARATVILFDKILASAGIAHIDAMLKRASGEQWLPVNLDRAAISGLPGLPGVYYFHNSKGKVIYVGKAINLKKRVSSHFTHNDPNKKRQHFLRLVCNITYKVCTNELHALVLESTEIKKLWPAYNYSQKQPLQKYGLYTYEDGRGYIRLAIDKKKRNVPAVYHFNMLHEGLVLLKKMVDEFGLNHKLCHLDKTPLVPDELMECQPETYNLKVKAALLALDKQLPTFAIVDEGLSPEQKLCLLIERGSFWGMGYLDNTSKYESISVLKEKLDPHADNDFIRNSIYSFAAQYPGRKVLFES